MTDEIETFTETGLKLRSGQEIAADLWSPPPASPCRSSAAPRSTSTASPPIAASTLSYKGMMFSDVPNLASVFGYTNASWTLKADLICGYVCRLLDHMERHGYSRCTPRNTDPTIERLPPVDFSSGYFQRTIDKLPRQGSRKPWRIHQNYLHDLIALRLAAIGGWRAGVLAAAPAG